MIQMGKERGSNAWMVRKLGKEADKAVLQVAELIPHPVGEKRPWLIVVPSQEVLKEVFGWGDGTGALGVYQALQQIYGLDRRNFEQGWQAWYGQDKRWFQRL